MLDVTPEDMARWPFETRVLWDMALESGSVKVWNKRMRDRFMRKACSEVPSFPRIYRVQIEPDGARSYRPAGHVDFAISEDVSIREDFDLHQVFVPGGMPVYNYGPFQDAIERQDQALANALAAAINAPPDQLRVVAWSRRSGKTALMQSMLEAATAPIGQPFASPINMRSPRQRKAAARQALERARPQRRLDGRAR